MKVLIFIAVVSCAWAAGIRNVIQGEGPTCPIDDPLTINPSNINISIPPLFVLDVGSTQGGGVALGLSSLWTFTTFNLVGPALDFEVKITSAQATGVSYSGTGAISAGPISESILPSGNFVGSGSYAGSVTDFHIKGRAVFLVNLITNKITVRTLTVDTLTFGELNVNLSDLNIGGTAVDWATWNAGIKQNFESDWSTKKTEIIEHVRVSANEKLSEYTIQDILDLLEPSECPERH